MNRRSLLGAMLAACTAPAILGSGVAMKLWTPPAPKLWTPEFGLIGSEDFTLEGWVNGKQLDELRVSKIARLNGLDLSPAVVDRGWTHIAVTRRGLYRDGRHRPEGPTTGERLAIDLMVDTAKAMGVALS